MDSRVQDWAAVRRALAGRHALLATTDPVSEAVCVAVLGDLGLTVDVAGSGVDAVVAARRHLPDLLVVGSQLEDVPGRQAAGWLRGNPALRDRPLLLLVDGVTATAQIQASGPGAVLRKPVTPAALLAALGALFGDAGRDADDLD